MRRKLISTVLVLILIFGMLPTTVLAEGEPQPDHTSADHTDLLSVFPTDPNNIQRSDANRNKLYYLNSDVTISCTGEHTYTAEGYINQLNPEKNVTDEYLCLNGYKLRGNGTDPVIKINSGITLHLYDCAHGGSIVGGGYGIENYGTLYLHNINISENENSGISNAGIIYMYDSTITSNTATSGGGIYNAGTIYMYGDSAIVNNTATSGGGVYMADGGQLYVQGGVGIHSNSSSNLEMTASDSIIVTGELISGADIRVTASGEVPIQIGHASAYELKSSDCERIHADDEKYAIKKGTNENANVIYYVNAHKHSFSYALSEGKIAATCDTTSPATCDFHTTPLSLELNASDCGKAYDGTKCHEATFIGGDEWEEAGLELPTIYYEGIDETEYTKSDVCPTDVGQYKASITVDTINVEDSFEITKADVTVTAPSAREIFYNGSAQELVNAGSASAGTMKYKLDDGEWSATIPEVTYVKYEENSVTTYNVAYYVDLDENYNPQGSEETPLGTLAVTISPKAITDSMVTLGSNPTYTGSTLTQTVNVADGTTNLNINTDYTLSGDELTQTDVDEYSVVVNAKGNYAGTITKTWQVLGADFGASEITANDYSDVYDGAPHGISVTIPDNATIKYGTQDGTYDLNESPTITNVSDGPLTVYYNVTKTGFNAKKGSQTVTILPKEIGLTWSTESFTYSGDSKLPTATATGLIGSDECNVVVTKSSIDNISVGTFKAKAISLNNSNYKLPANVESGDYTIAPVDINNVSVLQNMDTSQGGKKLYYGGDGRAVVIENATTANEESVTFYYGTTAEAAASKTTTIVPEVSTVGDTTLYYVATAPNHNDYQGEFKVTMYKAIVTAPSDAGEKTFTGETLKSSLTNTSEYEVTLNEGGIDAGQYPVTLTLKNFDNYRWSDDNTSATKTISFTIDKASQSAPSVTLEQNGEQTHKRVILTEVTVPEGNYGRAEYGYKKTGDGDETIKWQNGTTFDNLQNDTQYSFYVRYTGNENFATSEKSAPLTIRTMSEGPQITSVDAQGETVFSLTAGQIGENTLAVSPTGNYDNTNFRYQWYKSGTNSNTSGTLIPGATSASYPLPANLSSGQHYFYCVVSSDDCAAVSSNVFTVNVAPKRGDITIYVKLRTEGVSELTNVEGASVTLNNVDTLVTTNDGRVDFNNKEFGLYNVEVSYNGKTSTGTVLLSGDAENINVEKTIVLFASSDPNSGEQNTVVVKADVQTPVISAELASVLETTVEDNDKGVTPEDIADVDLGHSLEIRMTASTPVETNEILEQKQQLIEKANFTDGTDNSIHVIDLTLTKRIIENNTGDTLREVVLTELPELIEVTLVVPAELQHKDLRILRIHNGVAEELKKVSNSSAYPTDECFKLSEDNAFAKIYSKKFSTYAMTLGVSKTTGSKSSSGKKYVGNNGVEIPDTFVNGKVTADKINATAGSTVTLTVTPDEGFVLDTLRVIDNNGKDIALSENNGKYTFIMPNGTVEVKAIFVAEEVSTDVFLDVSADKYYYDPVLWAASNGITTGIDATHFGPDFACTRAQILTFLWRAAGSPVVNYAMSFTDVKPDAYYTEAVRWAVSEGITNGMSDTIFGVEGTCTRGQIATFLYRFAGSPTIEGASSFSDVTSNAYYANAVVWAKDNAITEGTSPVTFSPLDDCTRAQIVTFLYRYFEN